MATSQWGLLEEHEELELHKNRLLNVEERPFKRLTKRLVTPGAYTNPGKLPTPPPDRGPNDEAQQAADTSSAHVDVNALKEDITLDFAAFDSAIARLQFLATANAQERARYAADRLSIVHKMEEVRAGNQDLRAQLDGRKATLAQRRRWDELADRITGNRMLRTRAEQHVALAKLAEECDELARESATYGATWRERREQFGRLVDEGKRLRALIRDEKEEVERMEGMDSEDAEDGEAAAAAATNGTASTPAGAAGVAKGSASGNATPRPESGSSQKAEGSATPRPGDGGDKRTPRPDSPQGPTTSSSTLDGAAADTLKPRPDNINNNINNNNGTFSRSGSQAPSQRAASQQPNDEQQTAAEEGDGEDVEMGESDPAAATTTAATTEGDNNRQETPQITVNAPEGNGDKMDTT